MIKNKTLRECFDGKDIMRDQKTIINFMHVNLDIYNGSGNVSYKTFGEECLEDFKEIIKDVPIDIIGVSETTFDKDKLEEYKIDGYKLYQFSTHRGVALYVKENIKINKEKDKIKTSTAENKYEYIQLEMEMRLKSGKKLYIIEFYNNQEKSYDLKLEKIK